MPVGNWAHGAQARIVGRIHGQQTVNVFHFGTDLTANDAGALDTILLQLATALLLCVTEQLLGAVTQDWTVEKVDAKRIFPVLSDPIEATAPAGTVGTDAVTDVSFSASLLSIKTGSAGRRGRGRVFLPPPGKGNVIQSSMDSTIQDQLVAFATCLAEKFMGVSPTSDWHLGVFSRKDASGLFSNFNTGFRLATSLTPKADMAVISRRRKGHGR